jgi:hypothetical protein
MGVPIINARDTNNQRAPSVTSQMQEVGVVARLDEVLSAPEVVKHVLIGQAALDHSVRNHETCSDVHFFSSAFKPTFYFIVGVSMTECTYLIPCTGCRSSWILIVPKLPPGNEAQSQ